MYGNAPPHCDIAADRIPGQRLAALGNLRFEFADAQNLNIGIRVIGLALLPGQLQIRLSGFRLQHLLGDIGHVRGAQVTGADGGEHILGTLVVDLPCQLLQVHVIQGQAPEFVLQNGTPSAILRDLSCCLNQ